MNAVTPKAPPPFRHFWISEFIGGTLESISPPRPDGAACKRQTDGDARQAVFSDSAPIKPIGGRAAVSFTVCVATSVRVTDLVV